MATTEERMQVLSMIEQGQISAAEGERLLRALAQQGSAGDSAEPLRGASKPRWFRVRVTDTRTGRNKANVNIPIGLVNVGLRMGARFIPEGEQGMDAYQNLSDIIESGKMGKVFEVTNEDGGEKIEIFVE